MFGVSVTVCSLPGCGDESDVTLEEAAGEAHRLSRVRRLRFSAAVWALDAHTAAEIVEGSTLSALREASYSSDAALS
jgi:hypothetical protein